METKHRVVVGDSRQLDEVETNSVEFVVTSPPYPMIEMWDDMFAELNTSIGQALDVKKGQKAFELMHEELNKVWSEIKRVLVEGGIACINIGDATRKVDGSFRVYQNHSRITDKFEALGFEPLPELLWRKPVNSAAKFMGSGMLPPNAYVTLEHEYILIFRNGKKSRSFKPGSERRYNAAYFWEERNQWFSDVWMGIKGELQSLNHNDLRDRSAAYPFEIPYRLINMFSVYGDTVLDPFWGTGTTSLAAMTAGRNSIGYEIQEDFTQVFDERVEEAPSMSREVVQKRLDEHIQFVEQKLADGDDFSYEAENYDFPVTTKQEKPLQFYTVDEVEQIGGSVYKAVHDPVEGERIEVDANSPEAGKATSLSDF